MNIKLKKIFGVRTCILLVLIVSSAALFSKQGIVKVGDFSNKDLSSWEQKSFDGETLYEIKGRSEAKYLYASANKSASALYKKIQIDLKETPYLNWSWRIDKSLSELNEQTKAGDDYCARIYVIVKTGLAPWKTKALNYVWSSNKAPNQSWPNAFTDKAIMIPLKTSLDDNKMWSSEKVNVKLDFERYFGIEIETIDGVAIMVDTDNSGLQAAASFGDVFFSSN